MYWKHEGLFFGSKLVLRERWSLVRDPFTWKHGKGEVIENVVLKEG